MTVIAYKDGILAADSAVVAGGIVSTCPFPKILRLPDGRLIGATGFTCDCYSVFEWYRAGEPSDAIPKFLGEGADDKSGIDFFVVKTDGSLWRNTIGVAGLYPEANGSAIGDGTACAVAETAMRLGKSAEEAVALACEMCVSIYGPVQVERLHPKLAEVAD